MNQIVLLRTVRSQHSKNSSMCLRDEPLFSFLSFFHVWQYGKHIFRGGGGRKGAKKLSSACYTTPENNATKEMLVSTAAPSSDVGCLGKTEGGESSEVFTNLVSIFKTQIGLLKIGGMCEGAPRHHYWTSERLQ